MTSPDRGWAASKWRVAGAIGLGALVLSLLSARPAPAGEIAVSKTSFSPAAGTSWTHLRVRTPGSPRWTAATSSDWITLSVAKRTVGDGSAVGGADGAQLRITAAANPSPSRRRGTVNLRAGGQGLAISVSQAGATKDLRYVALGDSYSTGIGVLHTSQSAVGLLGGPKIERRAAPGDVAGCYRTTEAFPRLLAKSSKLRLALAPGDFRACGGSLAPDIHRRAQFAAVGVQTSALSKSTDLVTVTAGGNDMGFVAVVPRCLLANGEGCTDQTDAVRRARAVIDGDLGSTLAAAYRAILTKAPKASVYVVGYPEMAPATVAGRCGLLTATSAATVHRLVADLNSRIRATVRSLANPRLHFIDAAGPVSPFLGHSLCPTPGAESFIFADAGLVLRDVATAGPALFHPNLGGNQAYATIVERTLAAR